ncbi:MAG: inorganic phosphate transporter [Planctomycetota bacterium]|nr:inorganic phosphate transporter [Planctomycetota bacterium]
MPEIPFLLAAIVVVALIFDYTNGAMDSGNAIATVVSTKVLSPRTAVAMAAVLNLLGAFIGTKVASTMGKGIVNADMVMGCHSLILAALLGAIVWNGLTWYLGLPSSSSHSLVGGLMGAAIAHGGWASLNYQSILEKIILPLLLSPLTGFIAGYLLMLALAWMFVRANPRKANNAFRRLQVVSAALMATSHGTNDAQKTMGIITLALFLFGMIPEMEVPTWVKWACAGAMVLGTATGGWKIIKTMGHKIFKLEAVHGFAAETAATMVVNTASHFGAPISTTHVISAAVLGVGSSKRLSAVRWGVAGRMVVAWVLTIPAAALVGAVCLYVLKALGCT